MGVKAVESLLAGKTNYMVGLVKNEMELTPLDNAIKGKSKINLELLRVSEIMAT
jgi:6-phosphofructokinase 1